MALSPRLVYNGYGLPRVSEQGAGVMTRYPENGEASNLSSKEEL